MELHMVFKSMTGCVCSFLLIGLGATAQTPSKASSVKRDPRGLVLNGPLALT
jgi:hypothetical protein